MEAESIGDGVVGNDDDTQIHRALADERRRHALDALRNVEKPLTLTELARRVGERETDDETTLGDEEIRRRRISLYHCHLPKLADAGLVRFDADRKVASLVTDTRIGV